MYGHKTFFCTCCQCILVHFFLRDIYIFSLGMLLSGVLLFSLQSWFFLGHDPYYDMIPANLNTMNSYFIPSETDIDPSTYDTDRKTNPNAKVLNIKDFKETGLTLHVMSTYTWVLLEICILFLISFLLRKYKNKWFGIIFSSLYEMIYKQFQDILGEKNSRVITYVVWLFFVILFANLFWLCNDVIRFFFPRWLRNVTAPTGEMEFNIALAIISIGIMLYVQYKNLGWFKNFFLAYLPITGKGLIEGKGIWAKIGDIFISMFIGILDIIGTFAKIISLSMRLFGNMSSWSILLNVAFLWIWSITVALIWFNLVVWIPIIIYIQSLLVCCIQAFAFSLLVAISIKMTEE